MKAALIGCGVVVGLSAFMHPAGQVRAVDRGSRAILEGAAPSPEVQAIIARACQNCHSEKTEWPWYSYIAPISWMIESDVSAARAHMNLTNWQDYTPAEKIGLLSKVAPLVRNRRMPPQRYLALHPEAKLSAEDIAQLARWTVQERKVLRESSAHN